MPKIKVTDISLSEVNQSIDTKPGKGWRKFFAFIGPAYLVSVGYMDPGNWATDLAGGSRYGYALLWVLLMSNIMAMLLQSFSARLGIVRQRDLAQANREYFPKGINFILYIFAEIAIAATDLAEVLGMAIGIQLLTGLPLAWGVSITILDTFLLLYLQQLGMRKMEAFIVALVACIAGSFFIEIFLAKPNPAEVLSGFKPTLPDNQALYIAIGIIGATVMPHNLYLHSALVQTRKIDRTDFGIKQALKFNNIDTVVALNIAFLVNASILILAAAVFYKSGNTHIAEIKDAHQLLPQFLGGLAPILFAVALIAAGQSSTVTGTLAGQIVMEGYLTLRINPWMRRLLTRLLAIIPALIVILIYGEDEVDALLILSQVILSFQLAFAIIPLIHFVSDKKKMGKYAIGLPVKLIAWAICIVLVGLNLKMLVNEITTNFAGMGFFAKIVTIVLAAGFVLLVSYVTFFPLFGKPQTAKPEIHASPKLISEPVTPETYKRIAIALDFSENDDRLFQHAFSMGNKDTEFVLIHVVESVSAKLHGSESDDYETKKDKEQLENYILQLKQMGYIATGELSFGKRVKMIGAVVNKMDADLLVIGAHGHKGFKDLIFGETVNAVRHKVHVPVLVVHV